MGRLIEYMITVGVKKPEIDSTQSPELLRKFPTTDHKDFPLPPDIVFFCQPEGCSSALQRSLPQTNTFLFTLTDKETCITRYGICCNFYRPCFGITQERGSDDVAMGKSVLLDSNTPESHEIKNLKRVTRSQSLPLNATPHSENDTNSNMLYFSLTSVCIVSSYPFFSTFRECLFVFRKLVGSQSWTKDAKDSYNNEKGIVYHGNQNTGQISLLECRNWAIFFNTSEFLPEVTKISLSEIDEWVNKLLNIPFPVAGVNRVEVELLPRYIQPPLTFALPEKCRFTLIDYPVHLPLELLGVETCLKILTCILLEHKVVLQSVDYNALSISVMALASMLYPLQYMFPIIPLLPTCMKNTEQLLLIPTPYIIGIPSSFFRIKGASFEVPHDVIIVDLDTNKISVPLSMEEIPDLPEPDGSELKTRLNECLSCLSPLPREGLDGNDIDSVGVAVRVALVNFFCSPNVLGTFLQYTRVLRLYPRPVVAFLKQPFINSVEGKSGFLEALVETLAVQYYGEWMVNPENTVYRKVQNRILDPSIIGDKPRWFSHYIQPLYYQVYNPQSHLGLYDLYEDSDTDSEDHDHPSINVSNDGDVVDHCSCCSSFDESDMDETVNKCTYANDPVNSKIQQMDDSSFSTSRSEEESACYHPTVTANSEYTQPAYTSECDVNILEDRFLSSEFESSESNKAAAGAAAAAESHPMDEISVSTPHSIVSAPSSFPERARAIEKSSAIIGGMKPKLAARHPSTESISSVTSTTSTVPSLFELPGDDVGKYHSTVTNQKIYTRSISCQSNNSTKNQQLIKEVVAVVKNGGRIGWLTTKRLCKILEDEGLRQYLINQIDTERNSKESTLNDVHLSSTNIYKGYAELMKLVIEGYEHSVKLKGVGFSSLFPFLEVVARFYRGKKYTDDSTKSLDDHAKLPAKEDSSESTVKLESNLDAESDFSLHFHRDLSKISTILRLISRSESNDTMSNPSHTDTALERKRLNNGERKQSVHEPQDILSPCKENEGMYLVTKSNCSGGHRFYSGQLETSVFEPAGRGVTGRRYLFEEMVQNRSSIWDDMDFWEQSFLDFVASEQEATRIDVNPVELITRYNLLSAKEKRSLEEDEDILLGLILHNMIAFMICMNVPKEKIRTKVCKLLAKAHIGLTQTQWIHNLLDSLDNVDGNDIDLLVPRSHQLKIEIFVIHIGDSQSGPVFFLEIREDCVVLKSTNGSVVDRWWYENVVQLSCSSKTKVLCIWVRSGEQTDLHKVCTKKCKLLYNSIEENMKKATM